MQQRRHDPKDNANEPKTIKVSGPVDTRLPADFIRDLKDGQEKQDNRENWRFIIEIATLVVVALYTTVAIWQGYSNHKAAVAAEDANRIANTNLVETNRSWLEIDPEDKWLKPYVAQDALAGIADLNFTLHVKNIGRYPVRAIGIEADAEVVNSMDDLQMDYKGTHVVTTQKILYPARETLIQAMAVNGLPGTGLVPMSLDAAERKELAAGNKYILVYARGNFSDGFGTHWVQFCFPIVFVPRGYMDLKCMNYNDTGDGRPPWAASGK